MGQKLIDITGERRGKLLVIGFSHTKRIGSKIRSYWHCWCDCGNEKVLRKDTFYYPYNKVKSCGCLKIDKLKIGKKNEYNLLGDYGIGYTSKGEAFYFDLEDYNKIKNYCWFIS